MAPPGVSVHAARVTARAPWARWRDDRKGVEPEEDLVRGCRQFAAMRLSAVVIAHSSSSLLGGKGWDEATVASLSPLLGGGAIVTTNGLDTQAALRASGGEAAVPGPAALVQRRDGGGGPALLRRSRLRAGRPSIATIPGRKWRDLPPAELVGHGLGFEQEVEPLYAQIKAACPAGADGVLIAGTGFRCVGDPGGARAGSEAAGDLSQPGEPLALPALGGRRDAESPATEACSTAIARAACDSVDLALARRRPGRTPPRRRAGHRHHP